MPAVQLSVRFFFECLSIPSPMRKRGLKPPVDSASSTAEKVRSSAGARAKGRMSVADLIRRHQASSKPHLWLIIPV